MIINKENYKIEVDPLALGLTRPPMFMGINLKLFFANLMLSLLLCVDTHSFIGIPIYIFLHVILVIISTKEPNFLAIWWIGFSKTPPNLNNWYWKTNSYEPW